MKKWFLFFLILVFVPGSVGAFSLSPSKVEMTVDPGSIQMIEVRVRNSDRETHSFRPIVVGVEQTEQGAPRFVSGVSEIESWASTKVGEFVLSPNQEKTIQFSVDVPSGSYPGSYYLGLGVEQVGSETGNVNLAGRLVSLVNIKVAGTANEEIRVNQWSGVKKFWFAPNWKFASFVENKGNVELPLRGELIIYGWGGKAVSVLEPYLGNKLIPGTSRSFEFSFSLPDKNVFIPGIYQADFVLHYGLTNQKMVLSTKVWYIYPPILFLLLVVIFLPILFLVGKKIFIRRK